MTNMLRIRKVRPLFSQVIVTEEYYGYDVYNESGIIVATKGDIKPHQTVVAVGEGVTNVKPGDVVVVNLYRYCEFKNDPNSVKAIDGNSVVKLHLDEIMLTDDKGEDVPCFLIDCRDIKYVLEDFDEVNYDKKDNLVTVPRKRLILPSQDIKLY